MHLAARIPELIGGCSRPGTFDQDLDGWKPPRSNRGPRADVTSILECENMPWVQWSTALAVHGGVIPFGATFLAFADYIREPIRLSALSHYPSIWVFTHRQHRRWRGWSHPPAGGAPGDFARHPEPDGDPPGGCQ